MQGKKDQQQSVLKLAELCLGFQPLSDDGDELGVEKGNMSPDDLNSIFPGFDSR